MKRLKTATIWSLLVFLVLSNITRFSYFKQLFGNDLYFGSDINKVMEVVVTLLGFLFFAFYMVMGIMALAGANKAAGDRAYSLLRFVYVMQSLISLPLTIIQTYTFAKYTFANTVNTISFLFWNGIWLTIVILLIICKPEKKVQKVDLQDYDMVAFTTTGHRFVHYFMDMLFILPLLLSIIHFALFRQYGTDVAELAIKFIFFASYLLYCFLSELIFKQTLGKMLTRSCVVSDGGELSAGRIFGRTMARLIPFDTFSFLFGAKWHDRVSATAVVYLDSWEKTFVEPDKI